MLSKGQRMYYLKSTKELFKAIEFPLAELKNLLYGEKYIFFKGTFKIENVKTGDIF